MEVYGAGLTFGYFLFTGEVAWSTGEVYDCRKVKIFFQEEDAMAETCSKSFFFGIFNQISSLSSTVVEDDQADKRIKHIDEAHLSLVELIV